MTKSVKLVAQSRSEKNGKAKKIRINGFIPAVVYGSGHKNKNIKIKKIDFERAFELAGEFNLIDLIIDEKDPTKVIIKDVQKEIISDKVIHVDFYQVDMTKKITTEIPLNFIGEAKAVKELGGTLVKEMDSLKIKCLPSDLVSHIDVDLSVLNNYDDFIRLEDLKLPKGIELVSETNEMVANVIETRVEEEEKKPEAEIPSEVAPEQIEKEGKKTEDKEEKIEK